MRLSWLLIPVMLLRLVFAPACACVLACDSGSDQSPPLAMAVAGESCCDTAAPSSTTSCPCCETTHDPASPHTPPLTSPHVPHQEPCDPLKATIVWTTMRAAVLVETAAADAPRVIAGRTDGGKGAGSDPTIERFSPNSAAWIQPPHGLAHAAESTPQATGSMSAFAPTARARRARLCVWVL